MMLEQITSIINAENPNLPTPGKVLMILSATGTSKSTFINALTNHIYGVDWNSDFRYKLITNEGVSSQTNSQTSWITAYIFYITNTYSTLPYTLTVIDTPGFGDTREKEIAHQIKELSQTVTAILWTSYRKLTCCLCSLCLSHSYTEIHL